MKKYLSMLLFLFIFLYCGPYVNAWGIYTFIEAKVLPPPKNFTSLASSCYCSSPINISQEYNFYKFSHEEFDIVNKIPGISISPPEGMIKEVKKFFTGDLTHLNGTYFVVFVPEPQSERNECMRNILKSKEDFHVINTVTLE